MQIYLRAIEIVIFLSYFVISCVVGYVYVRHRHYVDTCVNRLLLVTAGLFLMLCAFTHLVPILYTEPSKPLLLACAVVSFVAAVCTLYSFRDLDDYLRRRVTTIDLLRETVVRNLTMGYDLKVTVAGNDIISGVAGSYEVHEPYRIADGFDVNRIIKVGDYYFRIVYIVDSLVGVPEETMPIECYEAQASRCGPRRRGSLTQRSVYGYDATAEMHMKEKSERLHRMQMDLCMSTAHHVRTPLSCLGVALTCLRSTLRGADCVSIVDEVFVHYEIINLVVRQFVDIATIESTTAMEPCTDFVDVRELVRRVEKVLVCIRVEAVNSRCIVGDGIPAFVLTDGEWLFQILMTLATNAARYTHSGSIDVDINLVQSTHLLIVVRDTGVGIPDSEKRDVFDKDFTNDATNGHGSTGLGLNSVKRKVSALGGLYTITDNDGGGTVLSVQIPVKLSADCYAGNVESNTDNVNACRVRSILVVDDTPSVRKLMWRFLKDHMVEVAVDGADGLQKMKDKRYDVVFLDMMMPVMDGTQCLVQFREWEKLNRCGADNHQVVYCMSATSTNHLPGFDGSMPKPVDPTRLLSMLQNL
ncbi:unnamed protein product [Ectocarpus sp. 4 AP-2014]|uniref:histidine kinase n=1 Tax=Ectocarpus siliculosus virus 1 (isolate New Zealand/Kaikoura/1988) TaxID=654926 RepID=Q8QKV4_ESV1K|nr:EsV-1-112 [Ectocarpus siliculosus virus 1]AAK14530.1 EsV-1-112 [Ectocarpus siliculosus virus 1]